MEEKIRELEEQNRRLREALRAIARHQDEIQSLLSGVKDLLEEKQKDEQASVSDEDVKNLLKKYSRL